MWAPVGILPFHTSQAIQPPQEDSLLTSLLLKLPFPASSSPLSVEVTSCVTQSLTYKQFCLQTTIALQVFKHLDNQEDWMIKEIKLKENQQR